MYKPVSRISLNFDTAIVQADLKKINSRGEYKSSLWNGYKIKVMFDKEAYVRFNSEGNKIAPIANVQTGLLESFETRDKVYVYQKIEQGELDNAWAVAVGVINVFEEDECIYLDMQSLFTLENVDLKIIEGYSTRIERRELLKQVGLGD